MATVDVSRRFARAERAFGEGRLADARADLIAVEREIGEHATVLHLRGLVEKRSGALADARRLLEAAARMEPANAEIVNNLGNLLGDLGEHEAALASYRRAIALAPAMAEARLNHAITLHKLGRFAEARAAFADLAATAPGVARLWSATGAMERDAGDLDAAAVAFDRALSIKPDHPTALYGRARVALERGEDDASARYAALARARPDDPEIALGHAEALEAEGKDGAIDILAAAVRARPEWIEGHQRLARMRSEAGDDDLVASFREAETVLPEDRSLRLAHAGALAKAYRYDDALDVLDRARAAIGEDDLLLLTEAMCAGEAGQTERATGLFERLERLEGADPDRARARHALRTGDPARAAALLESVIAVPGQASVSDWAHLSLAWRLAGDPREQWLCLQPGLFGTRELDFGAGEIAGLAACLRGLHRARAHPIGQSLRGGTQTRGRLFARSEPALIGLRGKIEAAIEDFRSALPPADPTHPLLASRDRPLALDGSWSVRLRESGFHINHIHPQGLLSSAFYVSLPEGLGDEESKAGWLDIGAPPVELGLDLPPLATIEPRPGRLALFPSYFFHGTRPFDSGERLTVAFDVVAR